MKLEGRTLQILKNYATINPSLQFKQGSESGSVLATMSPNKTVMAKAKIKETIPSEFAIYDLSRFLGVLSLFESPEIVLDTTHLNIAGNNRQVQYTYADPKMIVAPGDKEIKIPDPEIKFNLPSDSLQSVLKAMGVMGFPEIAVTGEGGVLSIEALDSKNPTSDKFSVSLGSTDKTFKMIFLAENIKILNEDYDVCISSKGIAHFIGKDIEYWVATESSSTYKG
jgi:hypothetical protein